MVVQSDYDTIMSALMKGDIKALEEYSELIDEFPNGKDHFIWRAWITNAVDCGNLEVVEWMLAKGVSVDFEDEEGFSVLHSAIDRDKPDKYKMMRALLEHGADVNAKGMNNWTPSHRAAVQNDLRALKLLNEFGADLTIRTEIDDYATPYEEALSCGAAMETLD